MRYVIIDTEGEVIFRFILFKIFINADDHGGCSIFGRKTVPASYYKGSVIFLVEHLAHVKVQWFAVGPWFLGTVEYRYFLHCVR